MTARERLIKVLIMVSIAVAAGSLILCWMLWLIYRQIFTSVFSAGGMRFPWLVWLLVLFIGEYVGMIWATKQWKKTLFEDKLGKNRIFSMDYQPYGDAHFADPEEYRHIAQIHKAEDCTGIILGQLGEEGDACISFEPPSNYNQHIMVVGTSGAGKSFSMTVPYILQSAKRRHSMIITDPKGELFQDTADYLEKQCGYVVRRFDLIDFMKSDGWDAFKYFRGLDIVPLQTNVQIFSQVVVNNIVKDTKTDAVYVNGAVSFLSALILYIILSKRVPESQKTVRGLNALLKNNTYAQICSIFNPDDLSRLEPEIMPAREKFLSFINASPNLAGNIVTQISTGLQVLQSEAVERTLSTDEIDLVLPGERPCAYFCKFSTTNSTFQFVSALFFSMLLIQLFDKADRSVTKRLKVPTDFVLDEFANIGYIPNYLSVISVARSYGISLFMAVQGLPQLTALYGHEEAEMIISNCGAFVDIGVNDEVTARRLEARIGTTSVETHSEHVYAGIARAGAGGTKGVGRDSLMSFRDIFEVDLNDCVIIFRGIAVIYAHKFPVTDHPAYPKLKTYDESTIPPYTDRAARKNRRIEEEIRLKYMENMFPPADYSHPKVLKPVLYYKMTETEILRTVLSEEWDKLRNKYPVGSIYMPDDDTKKEEPVHSGGTVILTDDDEWPEPVKTPTPPAVVDVIPDDADISASAETSTPSEDITEEGMLEDDDRIPDQKELAEETAATPSTEEEPEWAKKDLDELLSEIRLPQETGDDEAPAADETDPVALNESLMQAGLVPTVKESRNKARNMTKRNRVTVPETTKKGEDE